jgi:peptide/nickel transport system permease protein
VTRYLATRLLLAVPTFFGITLVTFGIIHLAPGRPGGGDPRSPRATEDFRRQHCLDLPLFFNLDVKDRRHLIREEIAGLADASRHIEVADRLRRHGTAAVPVLWDARTAPGVDAVLRDICRDHAGLCAGGDLVALRAAAVNARPRADYGTAAVAELMLRLEQGPELRRREAAEELAKIFGNGVRYSATSTAEERQRVLDSWHDFWRCGEREYREFRGRERIAGIVVQTQYAKWLGRIFTWDLGRSLRPGERRVADVLAERLPITLLLAALALLCAYAIGVPLGLWSAARRGTRTDRAVAVLLFLLYSMPSAWVASMLILLFGGVGFFDWFPIHGLCPRGAESLPLFDRCLACAPSLVLPVVCLSYASIAVVSRYQRFAALDVLGQDFIRTARAKGLTERALLRRHALRNALIPVITLLGLHIPVLLGGSVIVERIFGIPGLGQLAFDSITSRDYPTVMGETLLAALVTLTSMLGADLLYAVVDPRIAYERR